MTIADFITARIEEDEQIARAAAELDAEGPSWRVRTVNDDGMYVFGDHQAAPVGKFGFETNAQTEHLERHDPARALREVNARRRTLHRHPKLDMPGVIFLGDGDTCAGCGVLNGRAAWPCAELRDLAAVWADHPDFQPEWSEEKQ